MRTISPVCVSVIRRILNPDDRLRRRVTRL
jgi:hypothetical protein